MSYKIKVLRVNGTIAMIEDSPLPEDLRDRPAVMYDEFSGYSFKKLFNAGSWNCHYDGLTDSRNERRDVRFPEKVLEIIGASGNWVEWDHLCLMKEMDSLKKYAAIQEDVAKRMTKEFEQSSRKNVKLQNALAEIFMVNKNGGQGSRKWVGEFIQTLIPFCTRCNLPSQRCPCDL